MSVQGAKRPAQGGLVRRPRKDRAADQMELNGGLIRTDNSDSLYKAIVIDLLSAESGRDLSWGLALEELEQYPFTRRREVLEQATLLWCALILRLAHCNADSATARSATRSAGRRIRVLEGKQRSLSRRPVRARGPPADPGRQDTDSDTPTDQQGRS